MTKEQLEVRIAKKEDEIAKAKKNYDKYSIAANNPEFKKICDEFIKTGDYSKIKAYRESKGLTYLEGNEYYMYEKATIIHDASATLVKYLNSLEKLDKFDSAEKIPAIWNFLQNWKNEVSEFVHENAKELERLNKGYEEQVELYKQSKEYKDAVEASKRPLERYDMTQKKYVPKLDFEGKQMYTDSHTYILDAWRKDYFSPIASITRQFTNDPYYGYTGEVRVSEDALNKYLDEQVRLRYEKLVNDVIKITGPITDATDLRISRVGNLDGIIIGENGKAKIETIGAGGDHVNEIVNVKHGQIFHYRVLIHEIK